MEGDSLGTIYFTGLVLVAIGVKVWIKVEKQQRKTSYTSPRMDAGEEFLVWLGISALWFVVVPIVLLSFIGNRGADLVIKVYTEINDRVRTARINKKWKGD